MAPIKVHCKIQPNAFRQDGGCVQIMEFQTCGIVCAPAISESMTECGVLGFVIPGKGQVMAAIQGEIGIFPLEAASQQIHRLSRTGQFLHNCHELFIAVDILEGLANILTFNDFKGQKAVVRGGCGKCWLHDDHITASLVIRLEDTPV